MTRKLIALRFSLSRPRRATDDLVVGIGRLPPPNVKPPRGRRWCDLSVGDDVSIDGVPWKIATIRIEAAEPKPAGKPLVASGRQWIATGETLPEMPLHSTPP